jgi:hypothetical protein
LTFGALYAPFILADRLYQWIRFGSFTTTYFAIQQAQARAANPSLPPSFPYSTPFYHGFLGFLFSPAKSIFLCNPLIILAIVLVIKYRKTLDRYAIQFFLLSCFLLLADMSFYARFAYWYGDSAWGPRYVIVPSQLLAVIAVPVLIRIYPLIRNGLEKSFYWALVVCSCAFQFLSVLYDENLEIFQRNDFHVKYVIVWQRLVNTVALATGKFQAWGLDPGFVKQGNVKLMQLAFMPWRTEGQLPRHLTSILQVGWVLGCCLLFLALAAFLIQIRNKYSRPTSVPGA